MLVVSTYSLPYARRFGYYKQGSLVRRVLRKSVDCRKRNDVPMQQLMPPFTSTGLDFFRPLYAKRGRGSEKVYGCLFTFFTSRAIHIEDVSSLEA